MSELKATKILAVCSGCSIGTAIDADLLLENLTKDQPELSCIKHPALCSEAGIKALQSQINEKGAANISIAACSPRVKTEQFSFEGKYVERVNLREQVAWVMEEGHEDTQACAEDLVRMGIAKLDSIKENRPYKPENLNSDILVLGGGVSGLNAALRGAEAGYKVHLLEKQSQVGGYAGRVHKLLPSFGSMQKLGEPNIQELVKKVETHPSIELHLESAIASIEGEPGSFSVVLENIQKKSLNVGAVVLSTGWKPYETTGLTYLGYGLPGVKTLEEFEAYVVDEEIPDRLMFILCAGSRDKEHLSYCSTYCCSAALKQALYIREKNPNAQVYIVYRDIRTTGFQEDFYKEVQADDGIFLTRGTVETVSSQDSFLHISVKDSLLDENITLEADMLVLASGMKPNNPEDLNLQYRLGKGLPQLEYDFSDSHFICFPYETRRTGIYASGTVRAPMDMESSAEDGAGAMMKAIQCIESVKRGEAVHPRAGDMTWPELYMERCTDCKRCTEECPFGSYDETEKGTPLPNPARCRRCGICVGSCPERVIGFSDYNINSISAMIKSVSMPDEFDEKPRVLVFVCENDAYPALDTAGQMKLRYSPFVRIIPVRCLGSVNKVWISDALSHGYDGILQIGCKPGDDYQCHFIHGSELNEQRGENMQETLETMMLEPERVQTKFVEITDHQEIVHIINDYLEELELIGPNPFKSM